MIEQARSEIRNGRKRLIVHAPTGAGKTIVAASIVSSALDKGKKVLFLVHLRELAFQAVERFSEFGMDDQVGVIMAGEETNLGRPVQIASIQTYARRLQLYPIEVNQWFHDADLVIYDEAHASIARTRKAVLDLYKESTIILGLTATPCRADGLGLGEVYESIVSCTGIGPLTQDGYLVPVIYFGSKHVPDLKNIPTVAGDYNKKVLGERVDQPKLIGDIYDNWARIAHDRSTVIFAVNVKHSKHILNSFSEKGVKIEHVDAHTPSEDRQETLKRFRNGNTQVVTNVGVYAEGADFPWADCIVLARPSKSYARFVQMAGRGLRPYPGKANCIIIDHGGLVNQHGFLEDEVYWTLEGREKAWKKKIDRKREKKPLMCDECGCVFTGPVCPQCGTRIKNYGKKVATTDDELQELKNKKPKATREEKEVFFAMLEYERRSRGYAPGWSAHKFKEKMGVWPKGLKDIGPIEPDEKMKNWLTYQRIRWAKRKESNNRMQKTLGNMA